MMTNKMTEDSAIDAALKLCRGHYQEDIITGRARLSGGDLAGRARQYAGRYRDSRDAVLWRCEDAGIPWVVVIPAGSRTHTLVMGRSTAVEGERLVRASV